MIIKHNYFYFKKAIPLETCNRILKAARKKTSAPKLSEPVSEEEEEMDELPF